MTTLSEKTAMKLTSLSTAFLLLASSLLKRSERDKMAAISVFSISVPASGGPTNFPRHNPATPRLNLRIAPGAILAKRRHRDCSWVSPREPRANADLGQADVQLLWAAE